MFCFYGFHSSLSLFILSNNCIDLKLLQNTTDLYSNFEEWSYFKHLVTKTKPTILSATTDCAPCFLYLDCQYNYCTNYKTGPNNHDITTVQRLTTNIDVIRHLNNCFIPVTCIQGKCCFIVFFWFVFNFLSL